MGALMLSADADPALHPAVSSALTPAPSPQRLRAAQQEAEEL